MDDTWMCVGVVPRNTVLRPCASSLGTMVPLAMLNSLGITGELVVCHAIPAVDTCSVESTGGAILNSNTAALIVQLDPAHLTSR